MREVTLEIGKASIHHGDIILPSTMPRAVPNIYLPSTKYSDAEISAH